MLGRSCLARAAAASLVAAAVVPSVDAGRWYEDHEQAVQLIDAEVCSTGAIEVLGAAVIARGLAPELAPDPRWFSPSFRARRPATLSAE